VRGVPAGDDGDAAVAQGPREAHSLVTSSRRCSLP
jgi:hypothetical protein